MYYEVVYFPSVSTGDPKGDDVGIFWRKHVEQTKKLLWFAGRYSLLVFPSVGHELGCNYLMGVFLIVANAAVAAFFWPVSVHGGLMMNVGAVGTVICESTVAERLGYNLETCQRTVHRLTFRTDPTHDFDARSCPKPCPKHTGVHPRGSVVQGSTISSNFEMWIPPSRYILYRYYK